MDAFQQFPEEYSKSFQPGVTLLRSIRVRFLQDERSHVQKYWHFLFIVVAMIIHLCTLCTHFANLLSADKIMDAAYMLPAILVCIHPNLKAAIIVPKTQEISKIIKELGSLWRTELTEQQSTERNSLLKRVNFCNKVSFWVAVCGSSQYMSSPILETLFRRYVLHQDCEFFLPIAANYPFDPLKNWMLFIVVYLFQSYIMFLLVCVYAGPELMMITLCAFLSAEFMMLKHDLSQVKPTNINNEGNNNHSFKEFVERHQKLIMLSRQLDKVFNELVFIDLLFIGIITCAFNFAGQFARGLTYTINNYLAVAFNLATILYMCYYGELLMQASADLGDVAYQNLWYKGDTHYKKAIWLIIKISQSPCCMTSLRYAVVSLELFTKVMSTTWSYFSLMNTVYSFEE